MREKIIKVIKENNLIVPGDNVVVGVSGGPDSMALLYILNDIKKQFEFNLHVAHINHQIRGEEADSDEQYVKDICGKLSLPFYLRKINVVEYARVNRLSEEEAGREIRYGFFNEILDKLGGGKIAVAHNKNDQAETVLMRIIRGTGIDGLGGMDYKSGNIIRPLLNITRDEIEKFCEENNIHPRIDKTNLKPIYNRNKIRLELIPYIEENFNKGIIDTLFRISRVTRTDSDFLNQYTLEKYNNVVEKELEGSIVIRKKGFMQLHSAIKSRIIRLCIQRISGSLKGVEEKHINEIIRLINNDFTGKMINISNKMIVKISYDSFIIEKVESKEEKIRYIYKVNIDGLTYIKELDGLLISKILDVGEIDTNSKNDFIKYFDYDKIKGSLYVRNRETGDRFTPLGMKGSKKIKDFFIDEKIPREERDLIPLVTDENNIIWVIGYRISDLYKITKNTKKVLMLEYKITKEEYNEG